MWLLSKFVRDEEGVTAMEYGLMVALLSVSIISVLNTVGFGLNNTFTTIQTEFARGVSGG
jgi:pilus assembly protein Flp/PilA